MNNQTNFINCFNLFSQQEELCSKFLIKKITFNNRSRRIHRLLNQLLYLTNSETNLSQLKIAKIIYSKLLSIKEFKFPTIANSTVLSKDNYLNLFWVDEKTDEENVINLQKSMSIKIYDSGNIKWNFIYHKNYTIINHMVDIKNLEMFLKNLEIYFNIKFYG